MNPGTDRACTSKFAYLLIQLGAGTINVDHPFPSVLACSQLRHNHIASGKERYHLTLPNIRYRLYTNTTSDFLWLRAAEKCG